MQLIRRSLLQFLFFLPLTVLCQEKIPLSELPVERLLSLGYDSLPGNQTAALAYFEEAARREPRNRAIQEQIGYLDISLGRTAEALERFRISLAIRPSDTTKLQIAYLLSSLGKSAEARKTFEELQTSRDPDIASTARAESFQFSSRDCEMQFPWWWKVYAAPYYEGRFDDVIIDASLYGGRYLTDDRSLSLFGVLTLSRDTRSIGGALPVIYADNYALLAAGLRAQPFSGFTADVQAGLAQSLIDRPGEAMTRGDFRVVASYGAGWYPPLRMPDRIAWPLSTFGDVYVMYGYYSRYANTIGSLQARAGLRIAEYRAASFDLYLRGDVIGDSRRDYYNNVAEASVGARIVPDLGWSLAILAELHRGTYWGSSGIPNPYGGYTSFRLFLVFDRFLCW